MGQGTGIVAALTLGLAVSLHCVGMCGAMIMAVAGGFTRPEGEINVRASIVPQLLYHAGRLISYASLGAAVAAAGAALGKLGAMMGLHYITMGLTIAVLIAVAVHLTGIIPARPVNGDRPAGPLARVIAVILQGASRGPGAFTLGVLTGFLPCPPFYAALALAAVTPSPAAGAIFMIAFWAGTVPLLFALGCSSGALVARLRKSVGAVLAVAVITVAVAVMALKIASAQNPVPDPGVRASCPHIK